MGKLIIDIWIDGRSFGTKGAGFGIKLTSGVHDWIRTIPCPNITTNQAELKSLEFALKSINDEFTNDKVVIRSSNKYAEMMLEKKAGKWVKNALTNVELVEEVRKQYSRFSDITLYCDPEDVTMQALKQLTERAIKKGISVFEKK